MAINARLARAAFYALLSRDGSFGQTWAATATTAGLPNPESGGAVTLWKVNACNGKALSIRSEPEVWAPSTGEKLKPGEIFGVDKEVEGSDGVRLVRMVGGRGWVYDAFPGGCTLCEPVSSSRLWMSTPCTGKPLSIRSQPSLAAAATGDNLNPGDVFSVDESSEGEDGVQFLRLSGGRGWAYDAFPGGCQLVQPVMPAARLWIFIACTGKPLSIRSDAALTAPATGEKLIPGEIFAVDQELEGNDGMLFLRIVGNRGWAYDAYPGGCSLCQPIEVPAAISAHKDAPAIMSAQASERTLPVPSMAKATAQANAEAQVLAEVRALKESQAQAEALLLAEGQARAQVQASAEEFATVGAAGSGSQCSSHEGCLGLLGLCCPTADGVMLGCCGQLVDEEPAEVEDVMKEDVVEQEIQQVAISWWQVVHPRGVDIRSVPHDFSARTEFGHDEGDVFGVSEVVTGEGGVQFLRLSDGRGWLFDQVPGLSVVCEQIAGKVEDDGSSDGPSLDENLDLESFGGLEEDVEEMDLRSDADGNTVLDDFESVGANASEFELDSCALAFSERGDWWRHTGRAGSLHIDTEPLDGGKPTGQALRPGDAFLVDEVFHGLAEEGEACAVFLHLADGRGWITDSSVNAQCEKISAASDKQLLSD